MLIVFDTSLRSCDSGLSVSELAVWMKPGLSLIWYLTYLTIPALRQRVCYKDYVFRFLCIVLRNKRMGKNRLCAVTRLQILDPHYCLIKKGRVFFKSLLPFVVLAIYLLSCLLCRPAFSLLNHQWTHSCQWIYGLHLFNDDRHPSGHISRPGANECAQDRWYERGSVKFSLPMIWCQSQDEGAFIRF